MRIYVRSFADMVDTAGDQRWQLRCMRGVFRLCQPCRPDRGHGRRAAALPGLWAAHARAKGRMMNEYAVAQTIRLTTILQADDPDDALARYHSLATGPGFEATEAVYDEPDVWQIMAGVDYPSDVMPEDEDVLPPHGW